MVAEKDAHFGPDGSRTRPNLIGKIADANDVFQIGTTLCWDGPLHKLEPVRALVEGHGSFHFHLAQIGD